MLILQESCSDSSGSLVVYAPVELPAINIAMSGEDPSYIPLLPSGFSILPDWRSSSGTGGGGASTSSNTGSIVPGGGGSGGSLVTVAFQILVSSLPSAKINVESINTVNNLISTTVQQIKSALNCTTVWCGGCVGLSVWLVGSHECFHQHALLSYTSATDQIRSMKIIKFGCLFFSKKLQVISLQSWHWNLDEAIKWESRTHHS